MRTSLGRRFEILPGITVSQRFTIFIILMVLLLAVVVSAELWSTASMQRASGVVSRDARLSSNLLELQTSWISMMETVNSFSITLPPAEIVQRLEDQLQGYNQILLAISAQPLGATPEAITENQQITQELNQLGIETRALADQVYRSIQAGNWIASVQIRQTEMTKLQTRFETARSQLDTNLREEISVQTTAVQRLERNTRNIGVVVLLLAVIISLGFRWVNRRFTFDPLARLIANVQQVAQVKSTDELSPEIPLPQRDEIGDLSRAIAKMSDWVRQSYDALEERIEERTEGLERRTLQLQVAAEVARDIASNSNLEEMLALAVDLIRDRFGFYHTGIFLSDERHEYEVLRAATGDAGKQMLANQHKLRIGETGLVGYVSLSGEPRIASDVGLDAVHFKNPLLPETRSEVALPIKAGNRVIGVLDIQSKESAAFDQDSITTLQIIADQLAIAIQNARLWQEAQESLRELEKTYGRYDYTAWDRLLRSISTIGYQYDGMNVSPISETEGKTGEFEEQGESPEGVPRSVSAQPLSLPLRVRSGIIGTLEIWPQGDQLSVAETNLLTNISNRLSQIFESARLFEETQARAAREEAINRLTANLARSLDTDSVLQTAVREMAGLPSVVEATIFLETPSETSPDGAKGEGSV